MLKAILFDLDGTLVNSLEDLADATNLALSTHGFPTHDVEDYKYFIGNGMQNLIEVTLPENSRDDATRQKVFETFYEHYSNHFVDKTKAYDGIKEVLLSLKEQGYKLAVISNKIQVMTSIVVDKSVGNVFDAVYGKREGYLPKPDPALTLEVIRELGVKPENCVLIGDSGMDAATSVNVGCECIGALWGFRTEEELRRNGARYIAKEPAEILERIKEIENAL